MVACCELLALARVYHPLLLDSKLVYACIWWVESRDDHVRANTSYRVSSCVANSELSRWVVLYSRERAFPDLCVLPVPPSSRESAVSRLQDKLCQAALCLAVNCGCSRCALLAYWPVVCVSVNFCHVKCLSPRSKLRKSCLAKCLLSGVAGLLALPRSASGALCCH